MTDQIESIRDAANRSAEQSRNIYIAFILFGVYISIVFGGTDHEELIRSSPIPLPLISGDLGLPLVGFYWIAPFIFFLIHVNLLIQIFLLSDKIRHFNRKIGAFSISEKENERSLIYTFPLAQVLIRGHNNTIIHRILFLIVWITLVALPLCVLLLGQIRFIPYHDHWTTWWHRFLILADLLALLIIWPLVGNRSAWLVHLANRRFISRRWNGQKIGRIWLALQRLKSVVLFRRFKQMPSLYIMSIFLIILSLLVATIPDEQIDSGFPFDDWRENIFNRNVDLRERNLVVSIPTPDFMEKHGPDIALKYINGLDLRNRNLRYSDLSGSDLRKSDLRGADLSNALLEGANLEGADLSGANLENAQLVDVNLSKAKISEANLRNSKMVRANLDSADLSFSDFRNAYLIETVLTDAQLFAADFREAWLFGAKLDDASVSYADFRQALLHAASFQNAILTGADLREATFRASRRLKCLTMGTNWLGADLRGVELEPVDEGEVDSWVNELVRSVQDPELQAQMRQHVPVILNWDLLEAIPDEEACKSNPEGMFNLGEPLPEALGWSKPNWSSADEFDERRARSLAGIACRVLSKFPEDLILRNLEPNRKLGELLAPLILGDCPLARDISTQLMDLLTAIEQ